MLKRAFTALTSAKKHLWVKDRDKSEQHLNDYYRCTKTGDRKAVAGTGGYQPFDHAWLQAGSGRYEICNEGVTTVYTKKNAPPFQCK